MSWLHLPENESAFRVKLIPVSECNQLLHLFVGICLFLRRIRVPQYLVNFLDFGLKMWKDINEQINYDKWNILHVTYSWSYENSSFIVHSFTPFTTINISVNLGGWGVVSARHALCNINFRAQHPPPTPKKTHFAPNKILGFTAPLFLLNTPVSLTLIRFFMDFPQCVWPLGLQK